MRSGRRLVWILAAQLLLLAGIAAGVFLAPWLPVPDGVPRMQLGGEHRGELTMEDPWNLKDGSRYERVRVELQPGPVVAFDLSGSFPGELSLYGPGGDLVARTAGAVTPDPSAPSVGLQLGHRVREQGLHTLVISARNEHGFGPYTLRARALQTVDGGDLGVGAGVQGWLESGANRYRLRVDQAERYRISLSSQAFDALLRIGGAGLDLEDDDGGGNLDSRLVAYLQPGEYEVVAGAVGETATGLYTLAVELDPFPDNVRVRNDGPLRPEDPVSGWLQGVANRYVLEVPEAAWYTVELRSEDFDALLRLSGEGVDLEDDDGGGDSDSRIEAVLMPGTYEVAAGAWGDGGHGLYTVTVSVAPVAEGLSLRESGPLALDEPVSGWHAGSGHTYTLEVTESGGYVLDLVSDAFDTYLELSGPGVSLEDDDGGGGSDSRISAVLEPGLYEVRVRSYADMGSGLYTLTVTRGTEQHGMVLRQGGEVVLGETMSGTLAGDPVVYGLRLDAPTGVRIELRSSAFDALLTVSGGPEGIELVDDDGAGGTDSRVSRVLPPGDYLIQVEGFGGMAFGDYELSIGTE